MPLEECFLSNAQNREGRQAGSIIRFIPNNYRRQPLLTVSTTPPSRGAAASSNGEKIPWVLKDLRKTCVTYYDEHVPESSIEIIGHSVGGITYRHYAHRAPLAFKAITTLPQPTAFSALVKGFDGQCPCCRRPFADES